MQPKQNRSAIFRIILALGGFFLILAAGIAVLPKISERGPFKNLFSESAYEAAESDLEPLFYKELGQYQPKQASRSASVVYTVTIKVSKNRAEAEAIVNDLATKGIEAYFTPMQHKGRVTYHVRSGVFPDEATAKQLAIQLNQSTYTQAKTEKLQ